MHRMNYRLYWGPILAVMVRYNCIMLKMICIEKRLNFQNIKSDLRLKGVLFEIFSAVICLFFLDFYRFFDISGAITEPDVTRFSQNDCRSCKVIPSDRICSYKPLSQREHSYFFRKRSKMERFLTIFTFPRFSDS